MSPRSRYYFLLHSKFAQLGLLSKGADVITPVQSSPAGRWGEEADLVSTQFVALPGHAVLRR